MSGLEVSKEELAKAHLIWGSDSQEAAWVGVFLVYCWDLPIFLGLHSNPQTV